MTNIKKISGKILYAIFLLLLSIIMLLPVYYLLVTTFKTPAEAAASPLGLPRLMWWREASGGYSVLCIPYLW